MDIETFRDYCLSLPGTTEDVKWGDHLCFLVEEKIYVMCSLTAPHSFSIKVDPDNFDQLVARNGIAQAAYMAKSQWVRVDSLEVLPDDELEQRVMDSRKLIISKLTKKVQEKYV